jgi:hypothetical protein
VSSASWPKADPRSKLIIDCSYTIEWARLRRQAARFRQLARIDQPLDWSLRPSSTQGPSERTFTDDDTAQLSYVRPAHSAQAALTADSCQFQIGSVPSLSGTDPEAFSRREQLARIGLADFFKHGIDAGVWSIFDSYYSFRIAYIGTSVSNLHHLVDLHRSSRTLPLSPAVESRTSAFTQDHGDSTAGAASTELDLDKRANTLLPYPHPQIRPLKPWKPTPDMWCFSSNQNLADEGSLFPTPEVRDALVAGYFQHIYPLLPIISMPELLATYRNPAKPPPLLLFQALLMAGAHACKYLLIVNDRHGIKSMLFRRASLLYYIYYELN